MSNKARREVMRFCWAIKVPEGLHRDAPCFFGRGDAIDCRLSPLGVPALFPTEDDARDHLRNYVNPHRGAKDCRVVRVRVTELVEEVDAFPAEPHLRWGVNGQHYPSRRRRK